MEFISEKKYKVFYFSVFSGHLLKIFPKKCVFCIYLFSCVLSFFFSFLAFCLSIAANVSLCSLVYWTAGWESPVAPQIFSPTLQQEMLCKAGYSHTALSSQPCCTQRTQLPGALSTARLLSKARDILSPTSQMAAWPPGPRQAVPASGSWLAAPFSPLLQHPLPSNSQCWKETAG